jgi:DNA repair protein RecO (recombination protein O)
MAYLRDLAIVLKNEPFREHDSWVTLYGKEQGKMIAVARGARTWKAKQLGHLEPLSCVEVMIAHGQAFDKLAVARAAGSRQKLRQSLEGLTIGSAFANLVAQATQPQAPDEAIFLLCRDLLQCLENLSAAISPERATLVYASAVMHLLAHLGYGSHLDACVLCQTRLEEEAWAVGTAGGLLCPSCLRREAGLRERAVFLDPSMRKLLLFLARVSCEDVLKVSAPPGYFRVATQAVEELVQVLPIRERPHGFQTISFLLQPAG